MGGGYWVPFLLAEDEKRGGGRTRGSFRSEVKEKMGCNTPRGASRASFRWRMGTIHWTQKLVLVWRWMADQVALPHPRRHLRPGGAGVTSLPGIGGSEGMAMGRPYFFLCFPGSSVRNSLCVSWSFRTYSRNVPRASVLGLWGSWNVTSGGSPFGL